MSYEALLKAWRREKDSPDLQFIEDQFLRQAQGYLDTLNATSMSQETLEGKALREERGYASSMLTELKNTRLRKIVESILTNSPVDAKALTPGEQQLYANLTHLLSEYSEAPEAPLTSIPQPPPKVVRQPETLKAPPFPRSQPEPVGEELVVVRFLKPVPAIMGVDMKAYGPFMAEDVGTLPRANAVNLIKRGIAKPVMVEG